MRPIQSPITDNIRQETFHSQLDGSQQTYLIAEAGTDVARPLIIYLHGANNHQEQGMTAGIYDNTFARLWSWIARRGAIYVCPEYRGNSWMGPAAEADLLQIIGLLRGQYRPSKMILMGGSMGGGSALSFASRHPHLFDGVLALCPYTDAAEMFPRFADHFLRSYGGSPHTIPEVYRERSSRYHARELARVNLFIVHGAADAAVPVHHSRWLVDQLEKYGGRFKYVELNNGDHDAPMKIDLAAAIQFLLDAAPCPAAVHG